MIEVKNLSHIYSPGLPDETVALDDVSFTIEDGSFAGIIGHTGSGKTTLVQHLNGLIKPTSGAVIIDGLDIKGKGVKLSDVRKRIGLVFQYPEYQLFEQTVREDVAFGPRNLGLEETEIDERVRWALGQVGLDYEKFAEASPFDMSGGEKRKAAIAGVLAMKPDILILDEPAAGLDPRAREDMLNMVNRLHGPDKITIMISHNMENIARMCDQVLVIDGGRLIMEGSPAEVFARSSELRAIGLDVPPAQALMMRLKEAGFPCEPGCFDAESAAREIAEVLKSGYCGSGAGKGGGERC